MLKIVESHHHALSAWAEYRCTLKGPPRLLTLDHHTDTSKPFRNFLTAKFGANSPEVSKLGATWLREVDYRNPDSIVTAISRLSNDEHIVTAIQSEIISSALVIAHNARDTDLAVYRDHRIICRDVIATGEVRNIIRGDCDRVLESSFLESMVANFNQVLAAAKELAIAKAPYILDIDLDYFNTFKSIAPEDPRIIRSLAKGAGLITVATEPQHVKNCSLDVGLTSEVLLTALQKLLSS